MILSVFKSHTNVFPIEVRTWDYLKKAILKYRLGVGPLKDNYRLNENFIQANVVVLDFDDGFPLLRAIEKFQSFKCVIGTTKSHQKEKTTNAGKVKPACDRYRVFLFPENPILSLEEYWATVKGLADYLVGKDYDPIRDKNLLPFDPASFTGTTPYMPCREIVFEEPEGQLVKVLQPKPKIIREEIIPNPGEKGRLAKATLDFIAQGETLGNWHRNFFKSCIDLKEQNYSIDEARTLLKRASSVGQLDNHDESVLNDVYTKRGGRFGSNFRPIKKREDKTVITKQEDDNG